MSSLSRNVGFLQGLKYQGGATMIAWMLHRITGVGIILFAGFHILASFFMQQSVGGWPGVINGIYQSWVIQLVITFFLIFHGLNGLRIVILDLWPGLQKHQREAIWLEWMVIAPLYGLTIFILVQRALSGS
jgi:succinate dehydrogenase / fumarate reductase, cytochrome b subunit